jgi:predicted SAM-dependent methyltransferase
MRAVLRNSKAILGFRDDLRSLYYNYFSGQKSAIDRYLASAKTPSLHIGANRNHISGWLETDIEPMDSETVYLDATKTFPLASGTIAYIYSEHMIEHVPFAAGLNMLKECRRVLRPEGVLRVATPDLAFILNLYSNPGNDGRSYMRWMAQTFMAGVARADVKAVSIINNAFRSWGHKFLYDADTLESSLREAGFSKIVRVKYNDSVHEKLRGIERHGINVGNVEMAALETMIYEAS